jgi:hypothetical protein
MIVGARSSAFCSGLVLSNALLVLAGSLTVQKMLKDGTTEAKTRHGSIIHSRTHALLPLTPLSLTCTAS